MLKETLVVLRLQDVYNPFVTSLLAVATTQSLLNPLLPHFDAYFELKQSQCHHLVMSKYNELLPFNWLLMSNWTL